LTEDFMDPLQGQAAAVDRVLRPGEVHDAWQLKSGTAIMLRAVRPEDGEKMQALVQGLSMQSRYRRFFYPIRQLVPSMLARFIEADPMHAITLLAVVLHNGEESVIGMAQYVADPYPQRCEFAVVVSDAWQRNGIATQLIRNLVCIARTAGIERIEGEVLAENEPMRQLLIGMGFTLEQHADEAYLMKAGKALAAPAWNCSDLAVLALRARRNQAMAHA
jgi:RimJ/RimL family protein N-acetyltransferase